MSYKPHNILIMRDRRNQPEEENQTESSQQNILGNNQVGGNLTNGQRAKEE